MEASLNGAVDCAYAGSGCSEGVNVGGGVVERKGANAGNSNPQSQSLDA